MRAKAEAPVPLVIDASVVLAFYLPAEPYKVHALSLLAKVAAGEIRLVVPSLTRYAVLNVLSRCVRGLKKGPRMTLGDAQEILGALEGLHLEEHDVPGVEGRIVEIAKEHGCSAYDAAYLALAEQLGTRFVTADARLCAALGPGFPQVVFLGGFTGTGT
ncbi:MAG: type II toxin-antitoxin system VapC family toxin [Candidatus Bipolaricaulota bacterium]